MKPDSHYGLCFRMCLAQLGRAVRMRDNRAILNIVLEAGHTNSGDAERIFNEFRAELTRAGLNNFGDFSVATKQEALPLMVADFFAHSHSIINKKSWDLARFSAPEFQGDHHVMEHVQVSSAYLRLLKRNFKDRKHARMNEWRNKK